MQISLSPVGGSEIFNPSIHHWQNSLCWKRNPILWWIKSSKAAHISLHSLHLFYYFNAAVASSHLSCIFCVVLIWWIISHSWKLILPRLFASSTPALLCSPVTAVTDYLIRLCLCLWPQIDVFGIIINVQSWLHLSEDLFDSVYIHFTRHNNIGLYMFLMGRVLVCHISGLSQYSFGVDFKLNMWLKKRRSPLIQEV